MCCTLQSVELTKFQGYVSASEENISPLRRGENATVLEGDNPIYSCDGAVEMNWTTTGLMDYVEIRVRRRARAMALIAVGATQRFCSAFSGNVSEFALTSVVGP